MCCKINRCERQVMYKKDELCQMHYFRFMRNGTYDTIRSKKYRMSNPAGYQKLNEPLHPLVNSDGYVYEHRFVYFNEISEKVNYCVLCNDPITWKDCHIDHIDNDVTNNNKSNLRALCRPCNTFRGYKNDSVGTLIEINGIKMTASAWSRQDGVLVRCHTIRDRIKRGYSNYDAVYGERKTHINKNNIVVKRKYDAMRGIT